MSSIYAGIKVAKDIDANCLFSKREHTFLKYLYGLDAKRINDNSINNVYSEVGKIVKALDDTIGNLKIVIEEAPSIILLGKNLIPKKIEEVS